MSAKPHPADNRLLAAMEREDFRRWLPQLESVDLHSGQVLFEPDRPLTHAYFPTTAITSLMCRVDDSSSSEIAVIGHEGMLGIALVMGSDVAAGRVMVQIAGHAFRLSARALKAELQRDGPVRQMLLRYAQTRLAQASQAAVCARHHQLDQRLCGWLLQYLDRLPGNQFTMIHADIARLHGVRREGVTEKAGMLQDAGLIRYGRGHIEVLDRAGLERRACECYAAVKRAYGRLLPEVDASPSSEDGRPST